MPNLPQPPATPADLFLRFERLGIAAPTRQHEALFTVAQSRAVKEATPGGHTKNLFMRDKKERLFLITAEADASIDLKRLGPLLGATGRLSFGSPERLRAALGVEPGSVTPLAVVNDTRGAVTLVLDARLMGFEVVNVHPLVNTMTTSLRREDLLRFLEEVGHPPLILELPALGTEGEAA